MDSIDLLKKLRTIANENGDYMSLKTGNAIIQFLLDIGCLEKNPGSYGDFILKAGTPEMK